MPFTLIWCKAKACTTNYSTCMNSNTIKYEATIEDPQAFTRPWTVTETFRRITAPDYEQLEFACIEGNRDLHHYPEQAGGKAVVPTK